MEKIQPAAEEFSPCIMEFPFEQLASVFFSHVIQRHMIYRQKSDYNCITLITIRCFFSLLPFPFLAWYFSWDLLDQILLSPFIKIPLEWPQWRAAGSRAGEKPQGCCLGSAAFGGLCTPPLPSLNAHFATYLLLTSLLLWQRNDLLAGFTLANIGSR